MALTPPLYFWHLTTKRWEPDMYVHPKKTSELPGSCRGSNEPDRARTCVSPSIAGCLCANYISGTKRNVYRTRVRVRAVYPWNVPDSKITHERWIVEPIWFWKVGILSSRTMSKIKSMIGKRVYHPGNPTYANLEKQARAMLAIENALAKLGIEEKTSSRPLKVIVTLSGYSPQHS